MTHQRYSEQEWKELVLKFESRNISSVEFCRLHKISKATMYKWRDHFKDILSTAEITGKKENSLPRGSNHFIPISVSDSSEVSELSSQISASRETSPVKAKPSSSISSSLLLSTPSSNESSASEDKSFIRSSFNIRKSSFVLEFDSGCSISDLGAILEVVNAIK